MVTWDIDGLAERVAAALAQADVRAPNGRVSQVPDRRAIRWYATIGLLDPPLRTRGRTARYGERHLWQLIAVKLRQSQGRTLTEIQAELSGATDTRLREIATQSAGPVDLSGSEAVPAGAAPRARFWAQPPQAPPEPPGASTAPAAPTAPAALAAMTGPFYAVVLHPGATVLLPASPTPGDLAAIRAAARPLLDLLASRRLLSSALPPALPAPQDPPPEDPPTRSGPVAETADTQTAHTQTADTQTADTQTAEAALTDPPRRPR